MDVLATVAGVPSSSVSIGYVKVFEARRRHLLQTSGILVGFVIQPPPGATPTTLTAMTASVTRNIVNAISANPVLSVVLPDGAIVTQVVGDTETDGMSVVLVAVVVSVSGLLAVGVAIVLYFRCMAQSDIDTALMSPVARTTHDPNGPAVSVTVEHPAHPLLFQSHNQPLPIDATPFASSILYHPHREEDIFTNLPFISHMAVFPGSKHHAHGINTARVLNYNMLSTSEFGV